MGNEESNRIGRGKVNKGEEAGNFTFFLVSVNQVQQSTFFENRPPEHRSQLDLICSNIIRRMPTES